MLFRSYVLHFAASGEEGLRRVVELGPELIVILSDINMLVMDGLTLLREIKQRSRNCRCSL